MRSLFLSVSFAFLICGIAPAVEAASSGTSSPIGQAPSDCGVTTADALKAARLSLRKTDIDSEHAALACLIEAASRLEAQRNDTIRSDGTRVIKVPIYGKTVP